MRIGSPLWLEAIIWGGIEKIPWIIRRPLEKQEQDLQFANEQLEDNQD